VKKKSFIQLEREFIERESKLVKKEFHAIDLKIIAFMSKYGLNFLRYSLVVIFIWFGLLKTVGLSPATELVAKTVYWFSPTWFVPFLGWWEVIIGLCLLYKPFIRMGIFLMALQMVGTFMPLILLPDIVYSSHIPYVTLEGQYIVKNIVLISAALVIGSHVKD